METIVLNNNEITILDDLKADSLCTGKKISEIVSPSGDEWFDDEDNLRSLERGIQVADRGELVVIDVQALLKGIGKNISQIFCILLQNCIVLQCDKKRAGEILCHYITYY